MFERRHEPLISHGQFVQRLAVSLLTALGLIAGSLIVGILGYHFLGQLSWLDAFVNAAMILSGMGPVDEIRTDSGKVFAGCYALFSGIVFLSTAAILLVPVAHRVLHHFHLPTEEDEDREEGKKEDSKPSRGQTNRR